MQLSKETMSKLADDWTQELKTDIMTRTYDVMPLGIISIGDDPASQIYIRNKMKKCREIGIPFSYHWMKRCVNVNELSGLVYDVENSIFTNEYCPQSTVMIQTPVPHLSKHSMKEVIDTIDILADVDAAKPDNDYVIAPVANGIKKMLTVFRDQETIHFHEGDLAVVIGRSDSVGKPIARMLERRFSLTVAQANSCTPEIILADLCSKATIIVSCAGDYGVINRETFRFQDPYDSCFIIDVGTNRDKDGKLCGDVSLPADNKNIVTPVPGGVGPLTVLGLLDNVITLSKIRNFKEVKNATH